jgi:hypothetical protein
MAAATIGQACLRAETYRWKIACISGLASARLGLVIAQAISHLWARERPFIAHLSRGQSLILRSGSKYSRNSSFGAHMKSHQHVSSEWL